MVSGQLTRVTVHPAGSLVAPGIWIAGGARVLFLLEGRRGVDLTGRLVTVPLCNQLLWRARVSTRGAADMRTGPEKPGQERTQVFSSLRCSCNIRVCLAHVTVRMQN